MHQPISPKIMVRQAHHKAALTFGALVLVFSIGFLAFQYFQNPEVIQAGTADNVYGFAWSENIGWLSFNNTSGGGTVNYGVNIDPVSGQFSGYAWSENIGWIDFSPAGPYPSSPNYSACLDFSGPGQTCDGLGSNKAGGWVRALSYGGGWDGWIKLRGSNYGVDYTPQSGELSGYAWGSDVIGWLSFNCSNQGVCAISNYKVVTTAKLPPKVQSGSSEFPQGEQWLYCTDSLHPILHWTYTDGTQAAYWIQVDNTSAGFPSPEVDTGEILSSSQSYATSYSFNWNTNYWWHVKVKNQQGVWSGWSNTNNFNTPEHAYPKPDFTFSPLKPAVNELVQFTDKSVAYGGATITSWSWVFQDGNPASSNSQNPQTKFFSTGSKTVTLGVRDSDDYDCGITNLSDVAAKTIQVAFPLPKWKEIAPF